MSKQESHDQKLIPFIPEGDFYFSKGVEAYRKKKFDISLKWFGKAIEAKPNNPLYQCQMSIVYTEIGSYHLANQLLEDVLASHGEEYVDCYYLLANNCAHLGLLQDAKAYAQTYVEEAPDGDFSEEANSLLTVLSIDEEEEQEDEWAFDKEDDILMYQETVFYHLDREEWTKALALLEEMIAIFPDFSQARHEYAYALYFAGEKEEAIALEEEYVHHHPDALFGIMNLAIFYYYQEDSDKLEPITNTLVNIYPMHEQQKLRLAMTLSQIGFVEEAYQRYQSLSKDIVKNHASFYRWYSACCYGLGKIERAYQIWEEGCRKHDILSKQTPPWLMSSTFYHG
ncbi:hypothetical protein J416_13054 [Gracilibacillus halophilus YIM-C55.5]|uniref:Uncharacterized protein n=1 Tax=Gracilibacillus halophilus YIM-C55.5 TaxID=1308866 RepID=N4WIM6_9BACI|nr:tetratricopeptide repeat protein [Gracilibacillus halophilus]ENH96007.1 hypothetical protein J416_13054 [Gracilibacillus halophilus YIM-C55.5]